MEIDITAVASLARLELSADETRELGAQLSKILDYVALLDELDTEGVAPTSHAVPLQAAFRADTPEPPLDRELALTTAPEHDDEAFIVPRVV